MKRATILKALFAIAAFWVLPLTVIGINAVNYEPIPHIEPRYILTGAATGEQSADGNFLYYQYTAVSEESEESTSEESTSEESEENITGYAIGLTAAGKANTNLPALPTVYTDGETPITAIWRNGFHGAQDATITLGDNIKYIDFEAFLYSKIETFIIPNSVERIGDGAFYGCPDLKDLHFGAPSGGADDCSCTISDTGGDPKIKTIPSFCFFKCSALTNLTLPSSLVTIEPEAFHGCYQLQSTLLMPAIKTIYSRAFEGCIALSKIYIGTSMVAPDNQASSKIAIEPHAFQYCDPDLDFTFYGTNANINEWVNNHQNWGWHNDGDPAISGNKYSINHRINTGNVETTLWTTVPYGNEGKLKITTYNGLDPEKFISIPDKLPDSGGTMREVIRIDTNVFSDTIKGIVERIYLPTTLLAIESRMFDAKYTNLVVIADNTQCEADEGKDFTDKGRIDLSNIANLEFIGDVAFPLMPKRDQVKELHLPARLIAVGSSAFAYDQKLHFPNVEKFRWDYIDPDSNGGVGSRLEAVGSDAFIKLGSSDIDNSFFAQIVPYNPKWDPATIIFPKTFRSFGITNSNTIGVKYDKWSSRLSNPFTFSVKQGDDPTDTKNNYTARRASRPCHIFAGSPLIEKVIFRGGEGSENLLLPLQTFVGNTNLHTIIFEGRPGKAYTFHTQWGLFYSQQTIGSSGGDGSGKNDFSSTPMLQTIVLPNDNTTLRFQEYSFFGNSRAAMYFSGSKGENILANKDGTQNWPDSKNTWGNAFSSTGGDQASFNLTLWNKVGDESYFNSGNIKGYHGYCFAPVMKDKYSGDDMNSFDIDQEIPTYYKVHYKDTIKDSLNHNVVIEVGSAESEGAGEAVSAESSEAGGAASTPSKELVISGKYAYVCEQKAGVTSLSGTDLDGVATMSKYLYDMHHGVVGTATIPEIVTDSAGKKYQVREIGNSAFSACYCDGGLGDDKEYSDGYRSENDLCRIVVPNSIERIGNYAFVRAYNLTEISTSSTAGTYLMPSHLQKIGKSAFTFSRVHQLLRIPDDCVFYENTSEATVKTPSAFVNDFNLRKITFWDKTNSVERNISKYYQVTGNYTASGGGESSSVETAKYAMTTALYSLDADDKTAEDDGFVNNKSKLMVVLYRDSGLDEESDDVSVSGGENTFDGKWHSTTNAFVFGAYKMAHWIHHLDIGPSPTLPGGQPLFSGICHRDSEGVITEQPIYLNNPADLYYTRDGDHKCDLKSISGAILSLPKYACNGCESLEEVIFPVSANGQIPDGVFANVTSSTVKYYVQGATAPTQSEVNLKTSNYQSIGKEAFKNNTEIKKFTAPTRNNGFTIGQGAFQGCKKMTAVDFSGVTAGNFFISSYAFQDCEKLEALDFSSYKGSASHTLTIGDYAFSNCKALTTLNFSGVTCQKIVFGKYAFYNCEKLPSISWPTSSSVQICLDQEGVFSTCKKLASVELPVNTSTTLGANLFKGCAELGSVTVAGDDASPITNISNGAFQNCPLLNTFEFSAFTNISNQIGASAFEGTGTLGGAVRLPDNWSSFGGKAFYNTKMTSLTFEYDDSSLVLGSESFASNKNLTTVTFDPGCEFDSATYSNTGIFKNCGSALTAIYLPSSFELNTTGLSNFVAGNTNVKLYVNKKRKVVESEGVTPNESGDWTWIEGNDHAPVCYLVDSLDDVLKNGDLNLNYTHYWAKINGNNVYLGTTPAGSYADGVVTFSSGWKLSAPGGVTTWTAPS